MWTRHSGFEPGQIDSFSYIQLDEHLGRLTVRDLRQLESKVPLDTLKIVVDLAIDIGREGKPVGTMFVVASCRLVDASVGNVTLSKGLGARHWAAAAITKRTASIAVVVSEANGTVRILQNGEVILRIEPFRRAMKWVDFEYEPPTTASE